MNFSIRKTKAIFIKELKEYYRNPSVILMLLLPLAFSLLYINIFRNISKGIPFVRSFCIDFNVVFSSIQLPTILICEEKDKKTLDVLILSSVSPFEFIVGKILPIIIISIVSNILVFLLLNLSSTYIIPFLLITIINSFSMIILGCIIALICENQMKVKLYSILSLVIFFILPTSSLFTTIIDSTFFKILNNTSNVLGINQMNLIIENIISGKGLFYSKIALLIILIWLIIPFTIFSYIYKIKKLY